MFLRMKQYSITSGNVYNIFVLFSLAILYLVLVGNEENDWLENHPYGSLNTTLEERREKGQWCDIPILNPFDPSILKYIVPPNPIVCRSTQRSLTFIDSDGILKFNESAFDGYLFSKSSLHCQYSEIQKYHDGYDDTFRELEATSFDGYANVSQKEFVKIYCTNILRVPIYSYVHAHIRKFQPKAHNYSSEVIGETYNVLLFMIDSLSRQQTMRQLPKTYTFLHTTLKAIAMKGYMKIGDNTFPNLASVLTGANPLKKPQPFSPDEQENKPLDPWPFVWKLYSQKGYRTMYSEDKPSLNAFHYEHSGFVHHPTDHYLRPFWLAVESSFNHHISSPLCYCNRPKHLIQMDYVKEFINASTHNTPFWGLTFLTEASHDHIGTIGALDDDLVQFFNDLLIGGHLHNTFVFFMSDHGDRLNSIRHTYAGSVENNMPVNIIHVPETFKEKHSDYVENLLQNSKRLTSHYDVHQTLLDILHLGESKCLDLSPKSSHFARSLFLKIPKNRTCQQAGVPFSYCSCLKFNKIRFDSKEVVSGAKHIIKIINKRISNFSKGHLCAELSFSSVRNARAANSSSAKRPTEILRVMVEAKPSGGIFEAALSANKVQNGQIEFQVLGEIDRVNKYGNQPNCITDRTMRLFCYCK